MLDACYIVRAGDTNPELAYSLRSVAANLPHRDVVIAGYAPTWTRTRHLPVPQDAGKHENAWANLQAVLESDGTDQVTIWNDDMFLVEPVDELPVLHNGYLTEVLERREPGPIRDALEQTASLLADLGCLEPLCYDLHTPITVDRTELTKTLTTITEHASEPERVLWKTVHGNLWRYDGTYSPNVKVIDLSPQTWPTPLLSTVDLAFTYGAVGTHIRNLFPTPCRYEEA